MSNSKPPTAQQILGLSPTPALAKRVQHLLAKNRAEGLNPDEEREWERYERLEHLVRMAKAKAKLEIHKDRRPPV